MPNRESDRIKIALDAMGGDFAPGEVVKGAVAAAGEGMVDILLVGQEDVVQDELSKHNVAGYDISIVHASEVVAMGERPVVAVKEKTDSSIVVGINLLKEGEAAAFVSAGNTGAVMTAATLMLGRKKGIIRPALGAVFPFPRGPLLCLDLGANADCKPTSLVQFAHMGSVYMEKIFRVESPRVGLLSSGEEDTKGSQLVQKAHKMLRRARINFIGNVEGGDIASGRADVIVTDGFTGNVLMKLGEGLGEMLLESLEKAVEESPNLKGAADILQPTLNSVIGTLDYREYGGALLFGVNGNVIVAHGRSDADAIKSAISTAKREVEQEFVDAIGD
ncbi:MAG: phosphate acyltransferase PlsX [Chloroflexota bacterium]|nr:phosphate acyltransferase PlsX [Chloroflexota bacterium]